MNKNSSLRSVSLKMRVTLFTLVLFLGGIWSLTFLVSRIQREEMSEVMGREQFSSVGIMAGFIDNEVKNRLQVLDNISGKIPPQLLANPAALTRFLEDRPIFLTLFNFGIFVADTHGVVVSSLPAARGRDGMNFMDRDFIAGPLKDGKTLVGKPVKGRLQPGAIIGMGAPIRGPQGQVIGVVAGVTNLNEPNFLDLLQKGSYGRTGGYLLTSPFDHLVITATDKSRIMSLLPDQTPDRLTQLFREGKEGYGVGPNQLGVERIAAARNIPSARWQLIGSLPTEEGFAPIRATERRMVLLALALSLLASALTWWWLRLQFRPLARAQHALQAMSTQGGEPQPLVVDRHDEIGSLFQGFNRLLDVVNGQQRSLAAERQRLQNILSGTDAGTWELDLVTGEADANARWAGIIGRSLDELMPITQSTWSDNTHPADLPGAMAALGRHLAGEGDSYDVTIRMRHKDGHWVWVRTLARITQRGPDGQPLRVSGINLDVTEQKTAEEAMARTSALLQAVLDSASGVAIIAIGADQRISLFNKGAENLFGYSAAEVVGKEKPGLLIDREQARERLAASGGHPTPEMLGRKTEWTLIHKNGGRLEVALWLTDLVDGQGRVSGYLGVGYDVSQERRYERSLIEAKEQAEAATLAKSQFVSNMSHEIRTPMNAVLGLLQLLQATALDARQQDYVTKTEGAARSLLGLINDVLDVSKMDAGRMSLDLQPFRLDQVLRDLSAILSTGVSDKPVEVLFDIAPDTPRALVGDAMRLKQILINLGGNAIKFTLEGTVVLQVRVLARSAQDTRLRFSVIDTGIGIPPEQQERIFEGFAQAEASTTRRFGGTGLGLTICRELVRLMGGTLTLHSVVGQGSRFEFVVVLPHADPDSAALPALPLRQPLAPQRVLVVDDNAMAREILVTLIASWGWPVEAVASGAEALARLESGASQEGGLPEVLLVDWAMPGMDGWETLARLQALFPADRLPLSLMVTAHDSAMLASRQAHEAVRLDGYLPKPLTASMLHDALADAQAARLQLPTRRIAQPQGQPLAGLRLLLVEDNLVNQQVAKELLTSQGARVEAAGNGQLCLEALAAEPAGFDAVLMDLQMPVMDGFAATARIRAEPALRSLPVIAMTANALASDRQACLDAGMDEHVGKPFDLPHLVEVVLEQVARRRSGALRPGAKGEAALPAVLDMAAAMTRMEGHRDLYVRVLHALAAEASGAAGQLDALLLAGQRAEAARRMHALKGVAATAGADALAEAARQVETLLGDPSVDARALEGACAAFQSAVVASQDAVRIALQALEVSAAVPGTSSPGPGPGADRRAALETLDALRQLLAQGDAGALQVHERLCRQLGPIESPALSALGAALTAFDFQGAEAQCEALAEFLHAGPGA